MSAEQMQEAVVKPLEWKLVASIAAQVRADSVVGSYFAIHTGKSFRVELRYGDGMPEKLGTHPTLEAAKAAAQADYERRIRSALIAPAASSQERIAQLEAELEFAAMRIENAAIHMKIVTDQIGAGVDDVMPASIVKWTVNQLLKGQSEAAEAVARTRAAAPKRIVGAAK